MDWNGQLGLVQLGDGGETHCDEGKQLRLVQLGDGGGNSWVTRENLPKVFSLPLAPAADDATQDRDQVLGQGRKIDREGRRDSNMKTQQETPRPRKGQGRERAASHSALY